MVSSNFILHHIGYAVLDIENAYSVFHKLNYECSSSVIDDAIRNIKVMLIQNNDILIELVSILNQGKKSQIDFLFRENSYWGGGYHTCYAVKNMQYEINRLRKEKFVIIQPPAMSPVFESDVAFLFHKDIGIIELLQRS
jgi:hypothetical protein